MFPDELIASMKERDKVRLKAVKSKDERDWSVYKKLRNNAKTKEKRDHFKFKIENANDNKEVWKKLKEVVPNRCKKSTEVKRVMTSSKEETD